MWQKHRFHAAWGGKGYGRVSTVSGISVIMAAQYLPYKEMVVLLLFSHLLSTLSFTMALHDAARHVLCGVGATCL